MTGSIHSDAVHCTQVVTGVVWGERAYIPSCSCGWTGWHSRDRARAIAQCNEHQWAARWGDFDTEPRATT